MNMIQPVVKLLRNIPARVFLNMLKSDDSGFMSAEVKLIKA